MDKKKVFLLTLMGGMLLIFALSTATATQGIDELEVGEQFNMSFEYSMERTRRDYFSGKEDTSGAGESGTVYLNITNINKSTGDITYYTVGMGSTPSSTTVNNASQSPLSYSTNNLNDADHDGFLELPSGENPVVGDDIDLFSLGSGLMGPALIIAYEWSNYTENMDNLEQELIWAKGNFSSFQYSFNLDDVNQKIEIKFDYKIEHYDWDGDGTYMNGSVIYNYHQENLLDYDNYVINSFTQVSTCSIHSILNETYLDDNNMYIYTDSKDLLQGKVIGVSSEAISGFELIALLGVGGISVTVIYCLAKRNTLFN